MHTSNYGAHSTLSNKRPAESAIQKQPTVYAIFAIYSERTDVSESETIAAETVQSDLNPGRPDS